MNLFNKTWKGVVDSDKKAERKNPCVPLNIYEPHGPNGFGMVPLVMFWLPITLDITLTGCPLKVLAVLYS